MARKWTKEEEDKLFSLVRRWATWVYIGNELGRSPTACKRHGELLTREAKKRDRERVRNFFSRQRK